MNTETPKIRRYNRAFLKLSDAIKDFTMEAAELGFPTRSISWRYVPSGSKAWSQSRLSVRCFGKQPQALRPVAGRK